MIRRNSGADLLIVGSLALSACGGSDDGAEQDFEEERAEELADSIDPG